MGQIATFKIGEEIFGIDLLLTKEISRIHEITSVPEAPSHIYGLMNLRGQIVTVVKPAIIMKKDETELTEDSRLVILKTKGQAEILLKRQLIDEATVGEDPCALVIDDVRDVVEYSEDALAPAPPHIAEKLRDLVKGVVQRNKDLIVVLNVDKIIEKIQDYEVSRDS
jgi:purine-binding chemotaxis protein CheW